MGVGFIFIFDGSFLKSTCWQMLTMWHLSRFPSPHHISPNISTNHVAVPAPKKYPTKNNNASNIPCQQNQSKKTLKKNETHRNTLFCVQFVSPSVWCVLSVPSCLGLQGGQVQHGERSPDSPSPALGHPLLWSGSFAWKRQGSPDHGAESMAKAVMQDMEVSFQILLGKKLNKRRVASCSKIWL